MKFSRGSILVSLLLAASSSLALPPAPQGPYHSLEDERAGIFPQQSLPVQSPPSDSAMGLPYASLSSWSWGTPAYPVDKLPEKTLFNSSSDLPGMQQPARQHSLINDGGLRW